MNIKILIVTLVLGLQSYAQQKGHPFMDYKENDYTLEQIYQFSLGSSAKAVWFRTNLIREVNAGLKASGETIVVDESNLHSIIVDHTTCESRKLPKNFQNSRWFDSDSDPRNGYFPDEEGYEGDVGVFRYGKCELILFKCRCANLTDLPIQSPQQSLPQQQLLPAAKLDSTVTKGTVTNNYYSLSATATATGGNVNGSANSTNTNTNGGGGMSGISGIQGTQRPNFIFNAELQLYFSSTPMYRNQPPAMIYQGQPIYDPRGMPPGINTGQGSVVPGLGAKHIGMPPGITAQEYQQYMQQQGRQMAANQTQNQQFTNQTQFTNQSQYNQRQINVNRSNMNGTRTMGFFKKKK